MRKGTTPIFTFELPFDTDLIIKCKTIFEQNDKIVLEKYADQCTFEGKLITIHLTQEETYLFDCNKYARVQLRLLTNSGEALTSEVFTVFVAECLDEEVL